MSRIHVLSLKKSRSLGKIGRKLRSLRYHGR
jgi:hypothetical protein